MVTDAKNMRVLGQNELAGQGDGMHVNVVGDHAFVAHQGLGSMAISVVDISNPEHPELVTQIPREPGTHSHKVQVVGDVMLTNHEKNKSEPTEPTHWSAGLAIYDVSHPATPKQIGFFPTPGTGVHRMTYWEEPFAFVSGTAEGFIGRILRSST